MIDIGKRCSVLTILPHTLFPLTYVVPSSSSTPPPLTSPQLVLVATVATALLLSMSPSHSTHSTGVSALTPTNFRHSLTLKEGNIRSFWPAGTRSDSSSPLESTCSTAPLPAAGGGRCECAVTRRRCLEGRVTSSSQPSFIAWSRLTISSRVIPFVASSSVLPFLSFLLCCCSNRWYQDLEHPSEPTDACGLETNCSSSSDESAASLCSS